MHSLTKARRCGAAAWILFAAVGAALIAPAVAQADPATDIQSLLEQGKLAEAATAVDTQLAADPKNATYRFLKGLVLTRQNQFDKAEKVFSALTADHPELPEPYNNLAVIYAARGHYDKARELLQQAINTHPSYATAHENLGDIYAKMASEAYNQALELNQENVAAKAKLSLIEGLFTPPQAVAQAAPPAPAQAVAAQAVAVKEETAAPATENVSPVVALPKPQRPATDEAAAAAASPPAAVAPRPEVEMATVERALHDWAAAWAARDVAAYLSYYADDFTPPDGQSRPAWEQARTQRLAAPSYIKIELADVKVTPHGADHATATFTQQYQSDQFSDSVQKSLLLKRAGSAWLITQENIR